MAAATPLPSSPCPTLETERLVLRPFEEADLDAYLAVLAAPEVRWALRLTAPPTVEDAWAQMALFLGQWALRGSGQWAVIDKATGVFVGRAGLHNPVRRDWPGTELGWTLHPDHWRRGYATEAAARGAAYAFEVLGLDALYSFIWPENPRSEAVARRLGFELTETRRMAWYPAIEHGIWRLSAERWAAVGAGSTGPDGRFDH